MLLDNMKIQKTYHYYGEDADFFLNSKVSIIKIKNLDRERTAVSVRYEVED